jgi:DNA-binding CsgD family transcriptional regulator
LEGVGHTFERLGAWLFAAEAFAGAAVLLRRAGDKRQAIALERSTVALVRKCDGPVTPALRSVESQAILSARELEVASLAAAGLSNRAIADRLFVSVRTVETQLQHVYAKLGVSRRGELPPALGPSS